MSDRAEDLREVLEHRYRRLAASRQLGPLAATFARYREIDGSTLGVMVSVLLFTTVIPLVILGFSYFDGFADNVSPGTIWIRELGLAHPRSDLVRSAFGESAGLRSMWSVLGVAGFLVWGIPMSMTVAAIFALAWRRAELPLAARVLRGSAWFALYLGMLVCRERIAFGGDHPPTVRVVLFIIALVPVWLFWSLTPVLLVRHGGRGWSYLALAGFAGVVIDGVAIPLAGRLVFPPLLDGWNGFGPIGVAMALLTWTAVIGAGWIVTACLSAVLWERRAPPEHVVAFQTATLGAPPRRDDGP
jgi:hypothetical protein